MHPADMVFFWAEASPHQPAVLQPNASLSYRELARAISSISRRLDDLSLSKDEPIAVAIADPGRRLAVCYALLRRGIPVAPISQTALPILPANGILNTIYTEQGQVTSGGRNIRFDESWLRAGDHPLERWNPTKASCAADTSLIFFTSGTTGVPKKVVTPGAAIMARIALVAHTVEQLSNRTLVVPGLSSYFGFMRTAVILFSGRTACFAGDVAGMLRMIDLFDVETMIASPQQILAFVDHVERNPGIQLSALQQVIMGGAFATPELFGRVQTRLCRDVVYNYGSTESGLVASGSYSRIGHTPNAVGFPAPSVTVEIVDDEARVLPAAAPGRIRCRTDYFVNSFIAQHPEARDDVENIWWYPGDNGMLTESGILCVLGRSDDVINIGGTKIAGTLLDDAAQRVPGVKDAGVCGVPGASGIDELWIVVVPEQRATIGDISKGLANSPEFNNMPFNLVTVDAIPRNELGKLERHKIKQALISNNKR